MSKVNEVIKERDTLLAERERAKAIEEILRKRAFRAQFLRKDRQALALLNEVTLQKLKEQWRGRFLSRGLARLQKLQYAYFKQLLKKIEADGFDKDAPVHFSYWKGFVSTDKLEEQLKVYANDIVKRASQYKGSIAKMLRAKNPDWDALRTEIRTLLTDLDALIALLRNLSFNHETNREYLLEELKSIFAFPIETDSQFTDFLLAHWPDLMKIKKEVNGNVREHVREQNNFFFGENLLGVKRLLDRKLISWDEAVRHFVGVSMALILMKKMKLSFNQAFALGKKTAESKAMLYFNVEEVIGFFLFFEDIVSLFQREQIELVYAIDKSARILGLLFYSILRHLELQKGIRLYFIHTTREGRVTMYAKRQEEEIKGKNVLVIDDHVFGGKTMAATLSFLSDKSANKVVDCAFSSGPGGHHSVMSEQPSWYGSEKYAGVLEKPHGGVEVNKGARKIYTPIRKSILKLSKVIAEYITIKN